MQSGYIGYSLRGMCAVNHIVRVGGKRLSVIGTMSVDGIEDIYIAESNSMGMSLRTLCKQLCFLCSSLLMAQLQLFCSSHGQRQHSPIEIIHGVEALVRFLQSYIFRKLFPRSNSFWTCIFVHYLSAYTCIIHLHQFGFVSHCGYLYP